MFAQQCAPIKQSLPKRCAMISTFLLCCLAQQQINLSGSYVLDSSFGETTFSHGALSVGIDFSSETSYCRKEFLLGAVSVNKAPANQLSKVSLTEDDCDVYLGRDVLEKQAFWIDRINRTITFSNPEWPQERTKTLKLVVAEKSQTVRIGKDTYNLKRLHNFGIQQSSSPKTDVLQMLFTEPEYPKFFLYGNANTFGLGLVPGDKLAFNMAKREVEISNSKFSEDSLVLSALLRQRYWVKRDGAGWYLAEGITSKNLDQGLEPLWMKLSSVGGLPAERISIEALRKDRHLVRTIAEAKEAVVINRRGEIEVLQLEDDSLTSSSAGNVFESLQNRTVGG